MVRTFALVELVLGALIFAKIVSWIAHPSTYPFGSYPAGLGGVAIMCIPAIVALVGLIELVSNKPISALEETWAQMGSVTKLFLGTVVIIIASAVMITVMSVLL